MAADYTIAIIGSGPAGTSAAVRAAVEGKSHILLERAPHLNDTIFKYQKRKLVMATPEILPLRSDLAFKEESREEVIETWTGGVEGARVNLRLNAEVTAVTGRLGNFEIALAGGEKLTAEYIVLAIGVQGNIRKLTIAGADLPFVQYQLDDPDTPLRHRRARWLSADQALSQPGIRSRRIHPWQQHRAGGRTADPSQARSRRRGNDGG